MKLIFLLLVFVDNASSESTLKLVNLVYRHGDRSPVVLFKTDPNINYTWPQGLGWLSKVGMKQHYTLGQWLKHHYVDTGFMSQDYNRTEITVHSSDENRCLMSAYCNLAGLFPPGKEQKFEENILWQPIPVHTRPEAEDNTLNLGETCPYYKQLYQDLLKSPKVQEFEKENREFYKWLENKTGMAYIDIDNIWKVSDTIFCEKTHGLTLPSWADNATVFERLRSLNDYQFTLMYDTTQMRRLKGGPLMGEFIENMRNRTKPSNETQFKMYMYSGHDTTVAFLLSALQVFKHDTTIASLLSALQVFDGISPPYAAMVAVELHQNTAGAYYVNVYYKNSTDSSVPLTIPDCDVNCPLDQFVQLTKPRVPVDWMKECGLQPKPSHNPSFQLSTAWIVVIVLGVLLCLLLVINISMFVKYKRGNSGYKMGRLNEG